MQKYKRIVGFVVSLLTICLFLYYWHSHPGFFEYLRKIRPLIFLIIIAFYTLMTGVLVLIYDLTLRLCKSRIDLKEQTLLTMYSSIINFFGPLQSGPGFRSVYLKQRHHVQIRTYAKAALVYYFLFACWSGLFLLSGIRPWWKFCMLVAIMGVVIVLIFISKKHLPFTSLLHHQNLFKVIVRLALITLLQVIIVTIIYFVELRAIDSHIAFSQVVIYTGAANFSLFVSLTPGALGFRESFLFFSRGLHHINGSTIIAANLLDRTVYVMFLGLLFLAILAIHGKDKLGIRQSSSG